MLRRPPSTNGRDPLFPFRTLVRSRGGRERAYHGVNFGGLSVAGMVSNKKAFGLGLPGCLHLRHTQLPDHKFVVGQPETGAELAEDLQRFVDLHGADSIPCCIVEPNAGSTGALLPPNG